MSYPFYLGENLSTAAASRNLAAFTDLVRRNFDVIMNTRSQPGTIRKLRVVQLEALISRAAYRAGAHPDRLFEMAMQFLAELSRLQCRRRDELRDVLLRFAADALALVPDSGCAQPNLLRRFLDELDLHPDGQLTVEEAARRLAVSPSHLSRAVRLAAGRSPGEYIRNSKLVRARERLATASVTQAAIESGFGKVSWFIALFRRYYGETPGEYKRRLAGMPSIQYSASDQISGSSAPNSAIGFGAKSVF